MYVDIKEAVSVRIKVRIIKGNISIVSPLTEPYVFFIHFCSKARCVENKDEVVKII